MNPVYSITQWLLTLFFGPALVVLYNLVCGTGIWGPYIGFGIFVVIIFVSVLMSMPALLIHLFFNWLFFTRQFTVLFTKTALNLLSVTLILVTLVGFLGFDIDDPLVIGYGVAAVVSGTLLPIVATDEKREIE